MKIDIDGIKIISSLDQKLFSIIIDNQLTFKSLLCNMLRKASQSVNTLTRIASYMDRKKRRITMKAYTNFQFCYCALVLMMRSRTINKRIDRIHQRALRIVYHDDMSILEELLILMILQYPLVLYLFDNV